MNSRFIDRIVKIIIENELTIKEGEVMSLVVDGKKVSGCDPAITYIYELFGIKFFNMFDLCGSTKATSMKYAVSDKYVIKEGDKTNLIFDVLKIELRKIIEKNESEIWTEISSSI